MLVWYKHLHSYSSTNTIHSCSWFVLGTKIWSWCLFTFLQKCFVLRNDKKDDGGKDQLRGWYFRNINSLLRMNTQKSFVLNIDLCSKERPANLIYDVINLKFLYKMSSYKFWKMKNSFEKNNNCLKLVWSKGKLLFITG